ncbi:MAG: DUF485 domain-containing protein [Labedaea sp.]
MTQISSFTRAPETEHYTGFPTGPRESLVDQAGRPDFAAIRQNQDFVRLRRRLLRFTVPLTVAFLFWYLTYVLLAAYAHGFMSQRVTGSITVGLLLGLSQFVSTIVIMLIYVRFARRHIDPEVETLRRRAGVRD